MTLALRRNSEPPIRTQLSVRRPSLPGTANPNHLAHDARNWLTVLQMYCDLLRTSGAVASGYEKWIDELSGAVERGHGLVDSLLNSLLESTAAADEAIRRREPRNGNNRLLKRNSLAGITAPEDATLDLASALSRRLPLLQRMAGKKIHVEISAPDHAAKVRLMESEFERILYNLVGNAIDAMARGGRLRITLCSGRRCAAAAEQATAGETRPLKTVLLRVADSGTGIDPNRLPHIFEAGVSGKQEPGSHRKRHGFGLAIVRELTERAGGEVRVYSEPGGGCRFEVELPRI